MPRLVAAAQRGLVAFLLLLLWAGPARAASPITLEVQPLLGGGTPAVEGWLSAYVRVDNSSSEVIRGHLSLRAAPAWSHPRRGPGNVTEMPFSVAARSQVALEIPVHGFIGTPPSLHLQALGAEGQLLAEAKSAELRTADPLIFDLSSPSHVAPALRTLAIALTHKRVSGLAAPLLSVSSARRHSQTGEPVVPQLAAGYASATLVLTTAEQLASIGESARAALSDWMLAGGALALTPTRPEDLRTSYLKAWAGGSVEETRAEPELAAETTFAIPLDPLEGSNPLGAAGPTPGAGIGELRLAPSAATQPALRAFRGGNLRPSPWGSAASYGLGELHLLAFQPNAEPFVSDPWAHRKLADLTRHACERTAHITLPHAKDALDESRLRLVRKELDPNQGTRWTIIVSALLLLAYAGLAAPLNFYLARRSGKPLRALAYLPLWSLIALMLVVGLGMASRGLNGRARRLTLIEAGAGMSRATATRFRGLYAASASELVVQASARGNLLDVTGDAEETGRRLIVDREGARLTQLRGRPWEVVVVREDGFVGLGGGVSVLRGAEGEVTVKNRLGRDLLAVELMPGHSRPARFFARVADGAAVSEAAGLLVPLTRSGSVGRSSLGIESIRDTLDKAAKGLPAAWDAIEGTAAHIVDYWPEDVPVLIAQLDGGEGKLTDSGFPIEVDRALIRIVGEGGLP